MVPKDDATAATAPPDEGVTVPLTMDEGVQTIRLPEGWRLPGTLARVRREGDRVVLEPAEPPHPSWMPGFWEWVDEARARGDFGDFDPAEIEFRDLHFQEVELDDWHGQG